MTTEPPPMTDPHDIAREMVALPGWRWLPGMLTDLGERVTDAMVADDPLPTLGVLPDLTDPATLGAVGYGLLAPAGVLVTWVCGAPLAWRARTDDWCSARGATHSPPRCWTGCGRCGREHDQAQAGTVGRRIWHRWTRLHHQVRTGTDAHGRHLACLLATVAPECGEAMTPDVCPADIMPLWLAHLTPWLADAPAEVPDVG